MNFINITKKLYNQNYRVIVRRSCLSSMGRAGISLRYERKE